MEPQNEEPRAIPFITLAAGGKFELAPEAHTFLSNLHSRRIGIISMAGKYRTGKSYFINKVLLGGGSNKFKNGFAVGHSVNACTKGLLLWNRVIKASDFGGEANLDLLVVDTEGFDATDESANHNTRIFLFAVLLSSLFIYNSKLTIDERAIESLEMVIKLAQNLKFKESGDESADDIARTFPAFIWVVRDFALEKKNEKGENISEKQYLEKALEESKGISDQAITKNRIRKAIKKFFPRRDCMTFSRPAEKEEDLRNLDLLPDSELRDKFLTEIRKARESIFKNVKSKLFNGNEVSGPVFYELAQALVQIINSGQVPNIEQIGVYAYQETLRKGSSEGIKMAEKLIAQALQSGKSIAECREQIEKTVLGSFKENSIGDRRLFKEAKAKLTEAMNTMFSKKKNEQVSQAQKAIKSAFENQVFAWRDSVKSKKIADLDQLKFEFDEFHRKLAEEHKSSPEVLAFISAERIEHDKALCAELFERRKEEERQKAAHMDEIRFNLENNKLEVSRKAQEIEDLRGELAKVNERLRELQGRYADLEKEKARAEGGLEEERKNSQKVQTAAEMKAQQLEIEWMKKLEEAKRDSGSAARQKEQELMDLKRELAVKGATADSYKNELTKRDREVNEFEQTVTNLKADRRTMESKVADMEGRTARYEAEIKRLRDEIEAKNSEIGELKIARQSLADQISFLNSKCEDMKSLYDKMLPVMGEKQTEAINSPQLLELMQTNKEILGLLRQNETKNKLLKEKLQSLKHLRQIFQECENVQCRRCLKCIHVNYFLAHVKDCQGHGMNRPESTGHFSGWTNQQVREERPKVVAPTPAPVGGASSLFVRIKDSKTVNSGREYFIEYHMSVFSEDEKPRVLRKKNKDFSNLILSLKAEVQGLTLPKSSAKILGTGAVLEGGKSQTGDRKKILEDCVNDLAKIPEIRKSAAFRRFLSIDEMNPSTSVTPMNTAQQRERLSPKEDSMSEYEYQDDNLEDSGEDFGDFDDSDRKNLEDSSPREYENDKTGSANKTYKPVALNRIKELAEQKNIALNKVNKKISLEDKGF